MPHFTTTTQFNQLPTNQFNQQTKIEPPSHNITSDSDINPGSNSSLEAKKELCDSPTAPNVEEDVQKIQENNNNNQSEGESNSEELTPPKNQGLIKVMSVIILAEVTISRAMLSWIFLNTCQWYLLKDGMVSSSLRQH